MDFKGGMEDMSRVRPILFNTDMVRAILDGRKRVTRRVEKKIPIETHRIEINDNTETFKGVEWKKFECHWGGYQPDTGSFVDGMCIVKPPCQLGDILYVREAWEEWTGGYLYRAWPDGICQPGAWKDMPWRPSIHMPREAARIWLKVTDVRVERLQEITPEQIIKEGTTGFDAEHLEVLGEHCDIPFATLWDSTIKKSDLDLYGWAANPWVWVIEFEPCGKPDGWPE